MSNSNPTDNAFVASSVPHMEPNPADATLTVAPGDPSPSLQPSEAPQPDDEPTPVAVTSLSASSGLGVTVLQGEPLSPTAAKGTTAAAKSKKKKSSVTVTMATAATAQSSSQGAQGENTGRWTAEEHRLFLQGLEQHGKGWKKIASLIKSRTVVQIRTHAQKYFQKLAKARQNGEEGEIAMEGRGGTVAVPSASASAAQTNKRRRQTSGTKRKAIQSVVSSAQRQGKKIAAAQVASGVPNPTVPLPAVAPSLSHYVLPSSSVPNPNVPESSQSFVPSIATSQGTISGPALEDSLFRFMTPAPVSCSEPQLNEVARQAGANPITLPSDYPSIVPSSGGDVSPTGVAEFSLYPSWTDAKDTPSWYAKGSDVDALLDVADTLDWLTDTGDIHESYHPSNHNYEAAPSISEVDENHNHCLSHASSVNNMSSNALSVVEVAHDVVVPPLPSLFDGVSEAEEASRKYHQPFMHESVSAATIDEHLQVFDTPLEEHDFVSTILENTGESSGSLPVL